MQTISCKRGEKKAREPYDANLWGVSAVWNSRLEQPSDNLFLSRQKSIHIAENDNEMIKHLSSNNLTTIKRLYGQ
jgi:hypothetical protein